MSFEQPPSSQHPRFWDSPNPATLVFKAQDSECLFRQNVEHLAKHSQVFKDLLAFPQGENSEGTSANPIMLPGISEHSFERFLAWCHHLPWQDDSSIIAAAGDERVDQLLSLLHLGDMFLIRGVMLWSIDRLQIMGLHSAQILGIALKYRIRSTEWIDRPVKALIVSTPISNITPQHLDWMTPRVFLLVAKAKEAIQKERWSGVAPLQRG
ncbi:hypothetical protein DFP72DRAFT_1108470 [Ephemerocybe angulata]|uniref:BTB domain-containing protein n=1 Tax=Ephemerocybe angulata TaxID=980116 RepID=A0A8H6IIN2_9AGAR|nr:hypothetical protein DFP72DRAFT_1108470 [Tulosesus angulatus]